MSGTFYVDTTCMGCPKHFRSDVPVDVCPFCKTDAGLVDKREPVDRD
jgi:rRNA maturation endonuclease Nob1